jgi:hypothetical protein
VANGKHHLQLTVVDVLRREIDFGFRNISGRVLQLGSDLAFEQDAPLQIILRLILCHDMKPGRWIWWSPVESPRLCRAEESIARNIFSDFDLVESKTLAEDGNDLAVFCPEEMGYEFLLLHEERKPGSTVCTTVGPSGDQ